MALLGMMQRQEVECWTGPGAARIHLLPVPDWRQLPVSLASTSLWPAVKVKSMCLGISHSAWMWLGSSQLHAGAGDSLGCCSALQCSDVWHGDGAGNAFCQPMSQTSSQLPPHALPLSIPACSGGSFLHVSTAHASTGAWAANTCRWGKCAPLPRVRGLAVLCLPPERLGCSRGAQSRCALLVHPCEASWRNTSAPLASSSGLQPLGASRCSRGRPALQTQGGPWGLFGREDELGGGVQPHKARCWERADGVSSENI